MTAPGGADSGDGVREEMSTEDVLGQRLRLRRLVHYYASTTARMIA